MARKKKVYRVKLGIPANATKDQKAKIEARAKANGLGTYKLKKPKTE